MARQTKPKTKKSPAKAGKRSLFRNINLYSRKTQFLIIIILIAVMGGGYFTYKSSAATMHWSASASDGSLVCRQGSCRGVREPAKHNNTVLELRSGSYANTRNPKTAVSFGPGRYRTCIMAKGYAFVQLQPFSRSGSQGNVEGVAAVLDRNNYRAVCTKPYTVSSYGSLASVWHHGGETIRVASIYVEKLGIFELL